MWLVTTWLTRGQLPHGGKIQFGQNLPKKKSSAYNVANESTLAAKDYLKYTVSTHVVEVKIMQCNFTKTNYQIFSTGGR